MAEPLHSATSGATIDDTSLALPSDDRQRSGQQRVLDQVHSIKRSKSKPGRSGTVSPTSPLSPSRKAIFPDFGSFKFSPAPATGNGMGRSSTLNIRSGKTKTRSQSTRNMGTSREHGNIRSYSANWEKQQTGPAHLQPTNGLVLSRSEPVIAPPIFAAPGPQMRATGQAAQGSRASRVNRSSMHSVSSSTQQQQQQNSTTTTTTTTRTVLLPSTHSDSKVSLTKAGRTEQEHSLQNGEASVSNLTLKEAVDFLSSSDENMQQCGSSFIQHCTYREETTKQEVLSLGGLVPLVALLRSPNPDVSQSAAGALRNLVFKNHQNKLKVQQVGGIAPALELLKESDSTETQKQLTGLLWNLSSADELKGELITSALPVLTESVVVPFTCWSDSSANNNIHPDVFHSATGCLRNLSCTKPKPRQSMRESRGLIDSLMSYVQSCIAEDNPDDKSVENCSCILHNLSYQLETEVPSCFSKLRPQEHPSGANANGNATVGCFSPKSGKLQKENLFDVNKSMSDESVPSGVDWLCHPRAMQTYLALLGSSQNEATLEACCGALQNLTAKKGPASSAISQILVQRLGALPTVTPLLRSSNKTLQKTAMCLVGNMSRSSSIQTSIAKQVLPDLAGLLSSGTQEMCNSDETIATACNNMRGLLSAESEVGKKVLSPELVTSLADLSENASLPKGSKAASLLLYSLWNDKGLQGALKKLSLGKSLFVNDITTAAHKSVQVID